MAWYNSLKDLTGDIGHAAHAVLPHLGMVGRALDGENLGQIAKGAVGDAAAIAGAGGLGPIGSFLGHIPGVSQIEGAAHDIGGELGKIPGVGSLLGSVKQDLMGSGQPGGDQGILGKIGSFLGGNGGLNALGTAGAINAAMLQSKANDYAKNALGQVEQSYNERAPLRTGGMQAMQSSLAANPFSGTAMPARQPGAMPVNPTTPAQRPVTLGGY